MVERIQSVAYTATEATVIACLHFRLTEWTSTPTTNPADLSPLRTPLAKHRGLAVAPWRLPRV